MRTQMPNTSTAAIPQRISSARSDRTLDVCTRRFYPWPRRLGLRPGHNRGAPLRSCSTPPGDVIVRRNGWLEFSDWAAGNDLDEGHDCAAGRLRVDARHRG